jgi:hypothetical protein
MIACISGRVVFLLCKIDICRASCRIENILSIPPMLAWRCVHRVRPDRGPNDTLSRHGEGGLAVRMEIIEGLSKVRALSDITHRLPSVLLWIIMIIGVMFKTSANRSASSLSFGAQPPRPWDRGSNLLSEVEDFRLDRAGINWFFEEPPSLGLRSTTVLPSRSSICLYTTPIGRVGFDFAVARLEREDIVGARR